MDLGDFILILIIAAGLAFIPASIAKNKGYDFWIWWFYGWMLWIIAIIHVALIRDKNAPQTTFIQQSPAPYYPPTTPSKSAADELIKYKELLDKGVITQQEFDARKKELVVPNSDKSHLAPLLQRAFMFLEDGKWQEANTYCERVLDYDPENAQAYLGKLMAELQVKTQNELSNCEQPFVDSDNYQKAVRFGDEEMLSTLRGYISQIEARNENNRLSKIYDDAVSLMNSAQGMERYKLAADEFAKIPGFKDADALAQQCLDNAEALRLESERKAEEHRTVAKKTIAKIKRIFLIATPIVLACVVIGLLLIKVIIPTVKYNKAQKLFDSGNYAEAAASFEELSYKDSEEKVFDSLYMIATDLHNSEKYEEAFLEFNKLSHKDSAEKALESLFIYQKQNFSDVKVGSTIKFGAYEQDNDLKNGKEEIEWKVLAIDGNKALIISKYGLDCQQYNTDDEDIIWEKCTLRTWLNETFLNEAFGSEHQGLILETSVKAHANPKFFEIDAGNNTNDKVFLLSVREAEEYFKSDSSRSFTPTKYAEAQSSEKDGWSYCWLRSPGKYQSCVANFGCYGGEIDYYGDGPKKNFNVLPVLWINLETSPDGTIGAAEQMEEDSTSLQVQKQTLEDIKLGNVIEFGSYQQDANPAVGKEAIEWLVLAVEDDKALIISKYALDYKPYNTARGDITWERCSLRKWLNEEFLNEAFSSEHRDLILETTVKAHSNPKYKTNPGNITIDKVFLLSITEAEEYFSSDAARQCMPTRYAMAQIFTVYPKQQESYRPNKAVSFWLRSPGDRQDDAAYISHDGSVALFGSRVSDDKFIRPALWIKLD